MGKKRTMKAGYGKYHQRAEVRATRFIAGGFPAEAEAELDKLKKPNPRGGFIAKGIRGH